MSVLKREASRPPHIRVQPEQVLGMEGALRFIILKQEMSVLKQEASRPPHIQVQPEQVLVMEGALRFIILKREMSLLPGLTDERRTFSAHKCGTR
ncbi:hypothetical protein PCANC_19014 [Puccinia coronata f. sp. avenae]|uniref:Uncharacterized protein n=1 Tax=Puccinia coronata f. sp. avenae TaxID=200324 RepID=A0A2N5UHD8_9BASI|nr:hypothetical protein PCANC_19014 [Puccinia coronata f. sp. avenae]